jgi:hypothetical protein
MKRAVIVVALAITVILVSLIAYRRMTPAPPGEAQRARANKMVAEYSLVQTEALSLEAFRTAVQQAAGTNVTSLSEGQRQKLYERIDKFYACYSSAEFQAYKRFRLDAPYSVPSNYAAIIRPLATREHVSLDGDEALLRYAWQHFNSTNRLTGVDRSSIRLSVVNSADLQSSIYRPSVAGFPESAVICWEGAVKYSDSPQDLIKKNGSVLLFALDLFVRFNNLTRATATPLRLLAYWDPQNEDWRPLALCSPVQVGGYETVL